MDLLRFLHHKLGTAGVALFCRVSNHPSFDILINKKKTSEHTLDSSKFTQVSFGLSFRNLCLSPRWAFFFRVTKPSSRDVGHTFIPDISRYEKRTRPWQKYLNYFNFVGGDASFVIKCGNSLTSLEDSFSKGILLFVNTMGRHFFMALEVPSLLFQELNCLINLPFAWAL